MGVRNGGIDWDALAPHWHHFEHRGLTPAGLSLVQSALTAPCLFVGSGRGTLAARIVDALGPHAVIFADASLAMLHRSNTGDRAPRACCDVRALPFAPASFESAFCATGVLESMSPADRAAAVTELCRIVVPGGAALVAAILARPGTAPHDSWAELDAWRAAWGTRSTRWTSLELLATELGDREAAYWLLRQALPRFELALDAEDVHAAARAAGVSITARLGVSSDVAVFRLG